jgi:translocation and assembly module TamB
MPEDEIEQQAEIEPSPPDKEPTTARRPFFTRRNAFILLAVSTCLGLILLLTSIVSYRFGVFDSYIKGQFVSKMASIGIEFDADVFRVTVAPLELQLKNATFNDRLTGEKLFFVRDASLGLSVDDLYAWQLSRDITVNTTEISGAEAWAKFDENGRSNFANLHFVEEEGARINFKYESIKFSLRDSVVHFGDLSRQISGDANNLQFFLEPEDYNVPDEQKRYKLDLTSTESRFVYNGHALEEIDIRARGIADRTGADITELRIDTPIGTSSLNGTITDWADFKYDFNIESTVDLTQTSNIFPLGATLRGVGNFKGRLTGTGENYTVSGRVDADSLAAEGIYLKALNVEATVQGTNANYEANGNAVAELLTFDEFRIDFPRLTGNVRGSGSDFRWVGELQAIAAKTRSLTLGGLFLSDAVAEYKDKQFTASAGNGRAQKFSVADTEFAGLLVRNLSASQSNGTLKLSAPNATAASMKTPDYRLDELTGRDLKVTNAGERTVVEMNNLSAQRGALKDNTARNIRAESLSLTDVPGGTDIKLANLHAEHVDAPGTRITGVSAPSVDIRDNPVDTRINAAVMNIDRIEGGGAVLGSLNIAGVRLTVRRGTVSGESNDIDAGNVTLLKTSTIADGGVLENVKIVKPRFVVEPSGRYRASADMSIGGGIVGQIPLGNATAAVNVSSERVEIRDLSAQVMDGQFRGEAIIAYSGSRQSAINAVFNDLDLSKVVALKAGRVIPFKGQTDGSVNITFGGTDYRSASGTIKADISANTSDTGTGSIPINGRVELTANKGLFLIDQANLQTDKTKLSASGRFDLRGQDSDLDFAVNSADAGEVDRLFRSLDIAPELEQRLDSMDLVAEGELAFTGKLTGNLADPILEARASVQSVSLRGRQLGTVTSDVLASADGVEFRNGLLRDNAGGTVAFSAVLPRGGTNNISVDATLTGVDAGNLLAAFPVTLPERIRDFNGKASGTINLVGLPNKARGEINIAAAQGTLAGQPFDSLRVKAVFNDTRIDVESGEIRVADGFLAVKGNYDRLSTAFDFDLEGKNVPLPLALSFLPAGDAMPTVTGLADVTAKTVGVFDRPESYNVNFNGTARDVIVNENAFGAVTFKGITANQELNADLTAIMDGREQLVTANLKFSDPDLPVTIKHELNNSPLGPFFALVPQLRGISIGGTGTGRVVFGGKVLGTDAEGKRVFTAENLTGTAEFSQLALVIQDTPLIATEPVRIHLSTKSIVFESAKFAGGGSNVTVAGAVAFAEGGLNDLAINGRVNLGLVNVFPGVSSLDTFFSGYADVSIRLAGINPDARLTGTADLENASVATFIGSDRLTFDRLKGRVLFSSNQAQIERTTGYLGGGPFTASGGARFGENLRVESYVLSLNGTNITVPFPEDFTTTGDAKITISGGRLNNELTTLIAGSIRARRSLFSRDIDLASVVGSRREGSLGGSSGSIYAPRFDLTIEGRDALVIKNNIADLTASASLRLTGTSSNPQLSGRIVANSGTVFFRQDRYDVQRGVLEFPPNTTIEPVITLQAETEIAGHQIFVNLSGPLSDTENLNATVSSSPALPQADVISLITTGSLSGAETGIPSLARTGINTAAEILTDSIINNPARKATDKLFGLNVFEIDPIISGERLNPSARLTVGRQINNNLRITYATDLSQDQNQVLALEYRVSNKLSFVAQYEQRSLTNVTRNRDNFSFEVRFRRRF